MKPVVAGVALAVIVASCGGGGDSGADELAEAFADQIWEESQAEGDDSFPLERADADCLGTAVVDAIGYDTLIDAGITPEAVRAGDSTNPIEELDLDAEEGVDVFLAMEGCVDFAAALAESEAESMGISVSSAECVFEGFLELDAFRQTIVAAFAGDEGVGDPFEEPSPELVGAIFDLFNECLTDEELARTLQG